MADADQVRDLQRSFLKENEIDRRAEFWPVLGQSELSLGQIDAALPMLKRDGKSCMRPELADDIRSWLVEPDFSKEQRRPLDASQEM